MSAVIPVFIPHLGCPHKCVFCDQVSITGAKAPTPGEVKDLIERGVSVTPGAELAFYGGSFTAIEPSLRRAYLVTAREFLRSGKICAVRVSTRPDAVDDDILSELCEFGVGTVEIGAQSFSDRVLAASGRGHTAAEIVKACKLIRSRGLRLVIQLMAGLPKSTREDDIASAEAAASLSPWGARIYPVCVIKNTELYDMTLAGEYEPLSVFEGAERASYMIEALERKNVKIIRVGLNPTEELSSGEVFSGAYHPALGQIARSFIYLRVARELLKNSDGGNYILSCQKGRLSLLRGQKNHNVRELERDFPHIKLKFEEREQSELLRLSLNI